MLTPERKEEGVSVFILMKAGAVILWSGKAFAILILNYCVLLCRRIICQGSSPIYLSVQCTFHLVGTFTGQLVKLLIVFISTYKLSLMHFNQCGLERSLPGFFQYLKCGTRKNNILDKCYGNIKDAYVAKARPPASVIVTTMLFICFSF